MRCSGTVRRGYAWWAAGSESEGSVRYVRSGRRVGRSAGLIVRAAQKARADRLLTFNVDDFLRLWAEGRDVIAAP